MDEDHRVWISLDNAWKDLFDTDPVGGHGWVPVPLMPLLPWLQGDNEPDPIWRDDQDEVEAWSSLARS